MCRHAAYLGPPIALNRFLAEPSHSLMVQSWRPREQITATVNADGFGFGWYLDDGRAGVYANPMPIWSDPNLDHLGAALSSRLWIGNVRSATRGQPVAQVNTHPFLAGRELFSHNGFVHDFANSLRGTLRRHLEPAFEAQIRGSTDSEYLFAALRQETAAGGGTAAALRRLFARLEAWLAGSHGLFNLLIADGERIYATRHALSHASPSLYVGGDAELFDGGWLVASEPLTGGGGWQEVPDHHLVVIEAGREPRLEPL
ncbi:MAG TPA: ergothioneine biosynthesis protein EgtC [Alphaproteobacteria bacterium]